jgi:type IV secretion system protein VirB6
MNWLAGRVQSLGDFVFFRLILDYLRNEIEAFGIEMLGRVMQWVGGLALTLMITWIMIQGYRIVTGRSRESMMLLVMNSLRATLILTIATSMAMFGTDLNSFLLDDVRGTIHEQVTGDRGSPEESIDRNLAWMQVALTSIDALDVAGDPTVDNAKTRAMWFTGLGTAGPALVGGTMLLLYEVALALFIGLAPLFILSLLFEQTKGLFSRWLYYGIGTMFSMAVLSAMVSIALEMVARVAASFWATALTGTLLGSNFTEGITSQSMQQGGMGLILTVLIVSTPPMAAMFFQGTLGTFMAHSQVTGTHAAAPPSLARVTASHYSGPSAASPQLAAPVSRSSAPGYRFVGAASATEAATGVRGIANRSD